MKQIQGQFIFVENGCISPCPYTDCCLNFNIGCRGLCWWCGRVPEVDEKKIFNRVEVYYDSRKDK